jgi:hypothetical protein
MISKTLKNLKSILNVIFSIVKLSNDHSYDIQILMNTTIFIMGKYHHIMKNFAGFFQNAQHKNLSLLRNSIDYQMNQNKLVF